MNIDTSFHVVAFFVFQIIFSCQTFVLFDMHRGKLSPEDLERYSQQFEHIQQISQLYEQEPENFPKLINLLQQVCTVQPLQYHCC